ncbi:hypothetical protein [Weizmannia acidilactici]|uniref:hypothetical protein n=1 Tax=Weizmannia acidilactici TaxID=2607726 RepID=UPI00124E3801|nr:hypothetical protein [Weizmannia acidilactici]GER73446.1 hypothetical protein BpPP18_15130 [Weizmannia acidilactici]
MTVEIGVLIAAGGLLISFMMYRLNSTKEIKQDGQQNAELKTKLEYISKGVDDIRIDIKSNEKQMQALGERITRVEESAKQAHKRIDSLEGGEHA